MTVFPGSAVLVTGATGFIGAHVVKELLSKGYAVRAAVRSEKKFHQLKSCFPEEDLSYTLVTDIDSKQQLEAAVKGCDAVIHLASPFSYETSNFEETLLKPALEGTVTILRACLTEPRVKRVVITSSFAAIYDSTKGLQPGVVYTENDFSPLKYEDGARTTDAALAYRVSKSIAEVAAWDFMKQNKTEFDITVLCPTMVFGPLIVPSKELNTSNQIIWNVATSKELPPTKAPLYVDVRDVAYAEAKALECPQASNSRYIISAGDFDNQEIADILRENIEVPEFREKVPIGTPGARLTGTHYTCDNTKSIKELRVTYRPLKESVVDLCKQLL